MTEISQQQIAALEKKVGPEAKSPLFAQLAHYYVETQRAKDALRICDAGLANYPFYTTGHLVKGKALAALHMRAEARREFEFVLEFLPRSETIAALLEHIPPGEDETFPGTLHELTLKVAEPEYPPPAVEDYKIPSTPQVKAEPAYNFGGFDQPVQEPQPEPTPERTSLSGPSFFEAITQAPPPSITSDTFGFTTPSVEAPEIPRSSSPFLSLEVPTQEPPSFIETTESPETAFADIPRTVPEPVTEYSFTEAELQVPVSAPSEEESFEHYASRRRAELSGEDTLSLDGYFSGTAPARPIISIPVFVSTPQAASVPPEVLIPSPLAKEPEIFTPPVFSPPSVLEEPQLTEIPISLPVPERIEETFTQESSTTDTSIILPSAPRIEMPLSNDIQNGIEEIATKLQGAGKITPVIDMTQKETTPASEQDLPVSMSFVTPTLAEIYAKQGWYDDAIKAYKALVHNKPAEKERFEKRIDELERQKSQKK
jgi:hypothetical protein